MSLKIGDQAPGFSGMDLEKQTVTLADYRGRKNIFLVFYPKAFSPVCSMQLPRYNQDLDGFNQRDTEVIAVSVDNAFSQKAFCDALGGIDFPILSDMTLDIPAHTVSLCRVVLPIVPSSLLIRRASSAG